MRIKDFVFDFATLDIKGRAARGNIVNNNPVRNVNLKAEGVSTLSARKIWFEDSVMRLNTEERGELLGEFGANDKLLVVSTMGWYRILQPDLNLHFEENTVIISKFDPRRPVTVIYNDLEASCVYVKRFIPEQISQGRTFFADEKSTKIVHCLYDWRPVISVNKEELIVEEIADIMKYRAKGKKLSKDLKVKIKVLPALPYEEPIVEEIEDEQIPSEEQVSLNEVELEEKDFKDNDEGTQTTLF